jgi:hypothetical protein
VLVVAPWTTIWDRNFFAQTQPWLGTIMASPIVRGGVSGIGLITTIAGLGDLTATILRRSTPPIPSDDVPPPAQ